MITHNGVPLAFVNQRGRVLHGPSCLQGGQPCAHCADRPSMRVRDRNEGRHAYLMATSVLSIFATVQGWIPWFVMVAVLVGSLVIATVADHLRYRHAPHQGWSR
jgi:hypothetical protein